MLTFIMNVSTAGSVGVGHSKRICLLLVMYTCWRSPWMWVLLGLSVWGIAPGSCFLESRGVAACLHLMIKRCSSWTWVLLGLSVWVIGSAFALKFYTLFMHADIHHECVGLSKCICLHCFLWFIHVSFVHASYTWMCWHSPWMWVLLCLSVGDSSWQPLSGTTWGCCMFAFIGKLTFTMNVSTAGSVGVGIGSASALNFYTWFMHADIHHECEYCWVCWCGS